MWTPVWEDLPSDLRVAFARAGTALALLPCACSSGPGTGEVYGTLRVNMVLPDGIRAAGGTYLVASEDSEPVRFGTVTTDLAPFDLILPQGPDYVLSVNALGRKRRRPVSLECEGFRKFDVLSQRHAEITLRLQCEELWPEQPAPNPPPMAQVCGIQALVVGPLRQMVGASINANVTATPVESRFTWITSNPSLGHFAHAASDSVSQTRFTCEEPGAVTLTLVVSSPGCSDEASVQVSCVEWDRPDAGSD